jgi:phosphoglycolate phosphatase-like HAD superfamily hydrolase
VALRNAFATTGRRFAASETLIIGDSVLDIDCARQHNMRSLAVATGYTPYADLESAGADWVIQDLSEASDIDPIFHLASDF